MKDDLRNQLPPIVVQYIEKLQDTRSSEINRETACQTLERIISVSSHYVQAYKNETKRNRAARR
jgi:hypothetical protein